MDRHTDRQINGQTFRQTDGQVYRKKDGWTGIQTERKMDGQAYRQKERQAETERLTDREAGKQVDLWMEGQTDR